jgi:hypothetical protein
MSLKFIKNFLILLVLASFLYLSGCVEEPTIDPVKRPFSATRIANFAYNAPSIDVTIYNPDNTTIVKSNIAVNTLTDYFDLPSGKRRVVVTNSANQQVLLDKEIEFTSYEESSMFFSGFFSTDNLKNTFTAISFAEGDTYKQEIPAAGHSIMTWMNASTDSKDSSAKKYIVHMKMTNSTSTPKDTASLFSTIGSISYAFNSLEFGKVRYTDNYVLKGYRDTLKINGNVQITIINDAGKRKQVLATLDTVIDPGYYYYFYITGEPVDNTTIKVFEKKQLPLPARPK